jgi:hypothetical protein
MITRGPAGPAEGVFPYALSAANAGMGLFLLAPWLVLNPGPTWFRHVGLTAGPGAWPVALLIVVPVLYAVCAALPAAAIAIRIRLRRRRPSTLATLLVSAVLIAGLLSIPTLSLVTGPSGQESMFGGPLLVVLVWVLLLLSLMHTAGTYAEGRDGTILARWETELQDRPQERVDAAFFRPHDAGGPANGGAPAAARRPWGERLPAFLYVTKGALWFSLVMSFRIGSKDLGLGTWLTHIQPRPYGLVPTGGLRVICGIQSMIGSFLLALLLLTYFRPLFSL